MSLKNTIDQLAQQFAAGILDAIRKTSLQEILAESGHKTAGAPAAKKGRGSAAGAAPKRAKGGRLPRRSEADLQHVIGMIEAALSRAKNGMRSEELQKTLKLDKKEIVRPLALALEQGRIKKQGQKRATTYFAR